VVVLIEHMRHLVAGLVAQAREPVVALVRQSIEPGKGEIPQISQDQATAGQGGHHLSRHHLVILVRILNVPHSPPLLSADVKQPS